MVIQTDKLLGQIGHAIIRRMIQTVTPNFTTQPSCLEQLLLRDKVQWYLMRHCHFLPKIQINNNTIQRVFKLQR